MIPIVMAVSAAVTCFYLYELGKIKGFKEAKRQYEIHAGFALYKVVSELLKDEPEETFIKLREKLDATRKEQN